MKRRSVAAYRDAGADVIFIESPENVEELKAINEAFRGTPTLANMIEGGRTPVLPAKELEALGFALAIYPTGPLYAATKAVKAYMDELGPEPRWAGSSQSRLRTSTSSSACPSMSGSRSATGSRPGSDTTSNTNPESERFKMNRLRRRLLGTALAVATSLACFSSVQRGAAAEEYPTRPVTLVVPAAAGGPPTSWRASSRKD